MMVEKLLTVITPSSSESGGDGRASPPLLAPAHTQTSEQEEPEAPVVRRGFLANVDFMSTRHTGAQDVSFEASPVNSAIRQKWQPGDSSHCLCRVVGDRTWLVDPVIE